MHPALGIEDIIRLIINHISKDDYYHVALVCSGFLEPALDAIWDTLDDPQPLFCLWPDDAIEVMPLVSHSYSDERWMVVLIRELAPNEWNRFTYHAKRVRTLKWGNFDHVNLRLVHHLIASLTHPESPSVLLPNLRSLKMSSAPEVEATRQFFQLFVSPSLRDIEYRYASWRDQDERHTQAIIQSLSSNQNSLTSLSILHYPASPDSEHILKVLGVVGHQLRSIQLQTVCDWEVVEVLGSLPNLREMTVAFSGSKQKQEQLEVVPGSWFPALRVIRVDVDLALQILSSSSSAPWMTEICVDERWATPITPNAMARLIDLIASSCPNVQRIELNIDDKDDLDGSFAPLKKCSKLRHFALIGTGKTRAPTDEEYAELLKAWSYSEYLQVKTTSTARATAATLELLASLVKVGPLERFDVGISEIEMEAEDAGEGSNRDELLPPDPLSRNYDEWM